MRRALSRKAGPSWQRRLGASRRAGERRRRVGEGERGRELSPLAQRHRQGSAERVASARGVDHGHAAAGHVGHALMADPEGPVFPERHDHGCCTAGAER